MTARISHSNLCEITSYYESIRIKKKASFFKFPIPFTKLLCEKMLAYVFQGSRKLKLESEAIDYTYLHTHAYTYTYVHRSAAKVSHIYNLQSEKL